MKLAGSSLATIVEECGYSGPAAASKDLQRAVEERTALGPEQTALLRAVENERLDIAERAVQGVLATARQPAAGGSAPAAGRADPELVLKATDRLLRIQARRAALNGLDAPKATGEAGSGASEEDDPLTGMHDELAPRRLRKRGLPGG